MAWDRYGWWWKLEIVRWVSRQALEAAGGVLPELRVLPEVRGENA